MNRTRYIVLAIVVILALLLADYLAGFEDNVEARQYCDMVHLYKKSGGELGWPDYNRVYDAQCTEDGQLRRAAAR